MKKVILITFIISLCALSIFAKSNVSKDEYAIYEAVLQSRYLEQLRHSKIKIKFLVMADTVKIDYVPDYP